MSILFTVIPADLGKNITKLSYVITKLSQKLSNEFNAAASAAEKVEKEVKSEPGKIF